MYIFNLEFYLNYKIYSSNQKPFSINCALLHFQSFLSSPSHFMQILIILISWPNSIQESEPQKNRARKQDINDVAYRCELQLIDIVGLHCTWKASTPLNYGLIANHLILANSPSLSAFILSLKDASLPGQPRPSKRQNNQVRWFHHAQ
jgi:hypothetical protein